MSRWDGAGEMIDDEGEVGWAAQNALEVGETATGAPFAVPDIEVVGCAPHHDVRDSRRVHEPYV